jgi:hypothetical protein
MTGSPRGRHAVVGGFAHEALPGLLGARARRTLVRVVPAGSRGRRHSTLDGGEVG